MKYLITFVLAIIYIAAFGLLAVYLYRSPIWLIVYLIINILIVVAYFYQVYNKEIMNATYSDVGEGEIRQECKSCNHTEITTYIIAVLTHDDYDSSSSGGGSGSSSSGGGSSWSRFWRGPSNNW